MAIYESVAAENLESTAEELWQELSLRLCKAGDRRALRLQLDTISWQEGKETVNEFASRVRASALMLTNTISDEIMLDRFVQSLPANMRNLALSIPGTFDEVTSRVSMMPLARASEINRTPFRHERVKQSSERPADEDCGTATLISVQIKGVSLGHWIRTAKYYRCGINVHLAADCLENILRSRSKGVPTMEKGRASALGRDAQLPHRK